MLMKKTFVLLAVCGILSLSCCTSGSSGNLAEKFQGMKADTSFVLSSMCEPFDSAYVVTPYSQELPIEKNVKCEEGLKQKIISANGSPENSTFLLFVSNGEVVSYAEIAREYADFSTLGEKAKIYRNQRLYLDKDRKINVENNK